MNQLTRIEQKLDQLVEVEALRTQLAEAKVIIAYQEQSLKALRKECEDRIETLRQASYRQHGVLVSLNAILSSGKSPAFIAKWCRVNVQHRIIE